MLESCLSDLGTDLMTIELTVEELAKLRVCSSCVGERFLSGEIRSRGDEGVCSYCKDDARTFSIDELADEVSTAFRDHYYLTESEPDLMECLVLVGGGGVGRRRCRSGRG